MSNSCLEPMDCLPMATSMGSEDEKLDDLDVDSTKNLDINMESCTNPPTPASSMQVAAKATAKQSETYMHSKCPTFGPPKARFVLKLGLTEHGFQTKTRSLFMKWPSILSGFQTNVFGDLIVFIIWTSLVFAGAG